MRNFMAILILVVFISVSCTAATVSEPENTEDGDVTAITLITPESNGAYPAPSSAYPALPDLSMLPTSYPEITVVAPSGEVNPTELTPVTPGQETPQIMPLPGRPDVQSSPQLSRLIEAVTADLRQYLASPDEAVTVLSAVPIMWANGALGCPAEGVNYAEMQTEGVLITLEAAGLTYSYHTGGMQDFVLCQDNEPVSSGSVVTR